MNDASPEPARVLEAYLDDMLRAATGERPSADTAAAPVLLPAQLLAPAEDAVEGGADAAAPAGTATRRGDDSAARGGAPAARADGSAAPRPPGDYRFPLQCLMFRLGPHRLAIPLVRLGSVHKPTRSPTRLPGSPPWLLGLLEVRGVSLRVVDSLSLLTGEAPAAVGPAHLLVLDEGRWAITCDAVEQVVEVDADAVDWSGRNLRLGTIRRSLAGLLDPAAIVARLESAAGPARGAANR